MNLTNSKWQRKAIYKYLMERNTKVLTQKKTVKKDVYGLLKFEKTYVHIFLLILPRFYLVFMATSLLSKY